MKWWEQNNTTAIIKFYGDIYRWWNGADDFTNTFDDLQRKYQTIIIKVHCYGGDVMEGNVIQYAIANATCEVIIDIEGVAASMGSLFILPARKIRMAENGFQMIHEPKTNAISLSEKELYQQATLLKKIKKTAANAYATRSKKPAADFQKLFDGTDHWFDAHECLAMGLIDEIVPAVSNDVNDLTKNILASEKIETIYERFAASLNMDTKISTNNSSTMKADLIKKFGLTTVTDQSSDTAVIEALAAKLSGLEATVTNLTRSQVDTLIEAAETLNAKKFSDTERANLKSVGEKAGIEALQTTLSFIHHVEKPTTTPDRNPPPPPITDLLTGDKTGAGNNERSKWSFNDWSEKDEKGLMKMRTEKPEQYAALVKAQYGDVEIK